MKAIDLILARISIVAKIYVVIILFTLGLALVAWVSYNTVGNLQNGLSGYAFNTTKRIKLGLSTRADVNELGFNQVNMIVDSQTIFSDDGEEILAKFLSKRKELKENIQTSVEELTKLSDENSQAELIAFKESYQNWSKIDEDITAAAIDGSPEIAFALAAGDAAKYREAALSAISNLVEEINSSADIGARDLLSTVDQERLFIIATAIAATLIGCLLGTFISIVGIRTPIKHLKDAMADLASGNLETEISSIYRRDSIGEMALSVQIFKDNAIQAEQMKAQQEQAERKAEADKQQAMAEMASLFETSVGEIVNNVSSASHELQQHAQTLCTTAEQTTGQSSEVARASEVASESVQMVAASTEELTASIQEIARQVSDASNTSREAVNEADKTNQTVSGLAEAATKIGDVVSLINEIAEQTNLLALNATIEAARAGDAGKGFAVVANEVKTLASQTAKATEEITRQISSVQSISQQSVAAIRSISETINRIDGISNAIAAAVEQQSAATQEIARSVRQTSDAITGVSSNIQGVEAATQQSGSAATQVLEASGGLSIQSQRLNTEVENFVKMVRA